MKKRILAILAALVVVASFTAPAFAANPHFIGTPTITKNPDFSLTVIFKAAGLGNVVSEVFVASSGGSALIQCVNPGGNNPPAKKVDFGPLQGENVSIPPSNGQVTVTAFLGPPSLPGASDICPNPNWEVDILSLTYNNVVLHLQQFGIDILTWDFGDVDP